ncbi:uncharacterized protein HELO_1665A [Halomonas elongata DSM 2581]|nr:uncharacterized protein HELO_1665A [Halomonas elongata DSM 2581]
MPETKAPAPARGRAHQGRSSTSYVTTGPADVYALLDRLDKVKQTRSDAWQACCPAHDDRRPSLNVRLSGDGTILLKCWSGCGAADVVSAVGLDLKDLFPRRERDTWSKPVSPSQRWVPRDVIASLAHEALIAATGAEEAANGTIHTAEDRQRLMVAAGRLRTAAQEVGL